MQITTLVSSAGKNGRAYCSTKNKSVNKDVLCGNTLYSSKKSVKLEQEPGLKLQEVVASKILDTKGTLTLLSKQIVRSSSKSSILSLNGAMQENYLIKPGITSQ